MSWKMEVITDSKPSDSKFIKARLNWTEEAGKVVRDTFYDYAKAAVEEMLTHFLIESQNNGVIKKNDVSNNKRERETALLLGGNQNDYRKRFFNIGKCTDDVKATY